MPLEVFHIPVPVCWVFLEQNGCFTVKMESDVCGSFMFQLITNYKNKWREAKKMCTAHDLKALEGMEDANKTNKQENSIQ